MEGLMRLKAMAKINLGLDVLGKREDGYHEVRMIMQLSLIHIFQLREEIADQIRALKKMKEMAQIYGFDISQPAKNAKEAFQWLYFGYLAAIKTQNGAAMSVGRISTFLDIYIERDLENGTLTEKEAQELVDHIVMKFRMVKFARIPSYNQLFSGDPVWATLEVPLRSFATRLLGRPRRSFRAVQYWYYLLP